MKKQTAVEWLKEQYIKHSGNLLEMGKAFEKAKEMEKEHLYNFYVQGGVDAIMEADRNVEQYYNETFKSE
jgi:hypothetical protein